MCTFIVAVCCICMASPQMEKRDIVEFEKNLISNLNRAAHRNIVYVTLNIMVKSDHVESM